MKIIKRCSILAGLAALPYSAMTAELPYEREEGRYSFAQTYLGLENGLYEYDSPLNGEMEKETGTHQAFVLGGLHFWGHADFYLSFPLSKPSQGREESFSPKGIETMFRYFPWRLRDKSVRPFIGTGFGIASYQMQEKGETHPSSHKLVTPLQLGASYAINPVIIDIGVSYVPTSQFDYYVEEDRTQLMDWEDSSFFITLKSVFDSNAALDERKNQPLELGYYAYGALGVSAAWQWGAPGSQYVDEETPYLDVMEDSFVFPEYSLGFIAKRKSTFGWRSMLQLSYRQMEEEAIAFGTSHSYERNAYSLDFLESYADFQGFVPYVGISWNWEGLKFSEFSEGTGERQTEERNYHHFGLVGGWDILPRLDSRWFLRTNLRWYKDVSLSYQGRRVSFPNFEFNFLQFVWRFN